MAKCEYPSEVCSPCVYKRNLATITSHRFSKENHPNTRMEKTLCRGAFWMLLLFTSFPFSSGNSNDDSLITGETGFGPKFTGQTGSRPKYTFNHQRPSFGGGQEIYSGACVRGCHCWAQPDDPRQPVFVNCTNANKDTVPQVSVNALSFLVTL